MKNVKKNIYADMDPIEEIRAIREKLNRRFPTAQKLVEYIWKKYPNSRPENWSPESQPKSRRLVAKKPKRTATRRRKTSAHDLTT
ncbi:MAG: hypothetical protein FWD61_04665 [Phycisphaerales bacterium]|nr:hypothetical protein [Phycisphaerales bacterium]